MRTIASCYETGGWAVLENCHLSEVEFLPTLERIVEEILDDKYTAAEKGDETHKFRLWLTSMPDDAFP
jgi:hypothetical protein